ncbi:MAG: zinc finger domain-containing protein [Flavobacterium sp.]
MSKGQVHIRCSSCGTFNTDVDVCVHCGHTLNMIKQREQVRIKAERERVAKALAEEPNEIEKFLLKMTKHSWLVVRLFFKVIYGVCFAVMAIAMFLAWLIGMIVA